MTTNFFWNHGLLLGKGCLSVLKILNLYSPLLSNIDLKEDSILLSWKLRAVPPRCFISQIWPPDEADFMPRLAWENLLLPSRIQNASNSRIQRARLCSSLPLLCRRAGYSLLLCWSCGSLWPFNVKAFNFLPFEKGPLTVIETYIMALTRHWNSRQPVCSMSSVIGLFCNAC